MKVLHITTSIDAGAGSGAYLLHRALLTRGIDSRLLALFPGAVVDPTVDAICTNRRRSLLRFCFTQLDMLGRRLHPRRSRELFSWGLFGFDLDSLPGARDADIINLHWINHGMVRVSSLRRARRPVVWTLRDMWPLTGGCHYAFDCDLYQSECHRCPHLNSRGRFDAAFIGFAAKRRWYTGANFHPVAISHWLAECARKSVVLGDRPVSVIPNGIDLGAFYPEERRAARRKLSLPEEAPVVLFGATDMQSQYKGFSYFREAAGLIADLAPHFLFFGGGDSSSITSPGGCTRMGVVADPVLLRTIYSAADVFVAPSVAEAFGKTLVEAMACGTPVVCFDLGGPRDIVAHRETGWRARPRDAADLGQGIRWVLQYPDRGALAKACRRRVEEKFDINGSVVESYIDLYDTLAETENGGGRR